MEIDENTPEPVIALMDEQRNVVAKGGTMRLGAYETKLKPGTLARKAYGAETVSERHRHRYEGNSPPAPTRSSPPSSARRSSARGSD